VVSATASRGEIPTVGSSRWLRGGGLAFLPCPSLNVTQIHTARSGRSVSSIWANCWNFCRAGSELRRTPLLHTSVNRSSSLGGFSVRVCYVSAVPSADQATLPHPECGGGPYALGPKALFGPDWRRCGSATANRSPSPNREGAVLGRDEAHHRRAVLEDARPRERRSVSGAGGVGRALSLANEEVTYPPTILGGVGRK
jgi:hypothetical protein